MDILSPLVLLVDSIHWSNLPCRRSSVIKVYKKQGAPLNRRDLQSCHLHAGEPGAHAAVEN